jgi:hypothetical protein
MQNKGCGSEEERSKSVWQTILNPEAQELHVGRFNESGCER